jgi:hypothetical protein
MKYSAFFSSLAAIVWLSAGCCTMRTAENFEGVPVDGRQEALCTLEVENTGWFLFYVVPLICGNPQYPNANDWRFFKNTVTVENNVNAVKKEMERRGTTRVANLYSRTKDEPFFMVLYKRECHTSAVLLKDRVK